MQDERFPKPEVDSPDQTASSIVDEFVRGNESSIIPFVTWNGRGKPKKKKRFITMLFGLVFFVPSLLFGSYKIVVPLG